MANPIEFDCLVCGDLAEASAREWLETNGIGGFASSTLIDLNTRRYHGLLTAATKPPVGRFVLLSKLEDTLVLDATRYELSTNQYAGAIHPHGHAHLNSCRLDPFLVVSYKLEDLEIEKSICMVHGENTVIVLYEIFGELNGRHCALEVRPLVAFRDYHSTTHANDHLNRGVETVGQRTSIRPYPDLPTLHFAHNAEWVDGNGSWYYNFEYESERERGPNPVLQQTGPRSRITQLFARLRSTVCRMPPFL